MFIPHVSGSLGVYDVYGIVFTTFYIILPHFTSFYHIYKFNKSREIPFWSLSNIFPMAASQDRGCLDWAAVNTTTSTSLWEEVGPPDTAKRVFSQSFGNPLSVRVGKPWKTNRCAAHELDHKEQPLIHIDTFIFGKRTDVITQRLVFNHPRAEFSMNDGMIFHNLEKNIIPIFIVLYHNSPTQTNQLTSHQIYQMIWIRLDKFLHNSPTWKARLVWSPATLQFPVRLPHLQGLFGAERLPLGRPKFHQPWTPHGACGEPAMSTAARGFFLTQGTVPNAHGSQPPYASASACWNSACLSHWSRPIGSIFYRKDLRKVPLVLRFL